MLNFYFSYIFLVGRKAVKSYTRKKNGETRLASKKMREISCSDGLRNCLTFLISKEDWLYF